MIINCPHCLGEMQVQRDMCGQAISCPHCNNALTVPVPVAKVVSNPTVKKLPSSNPFGDDHIPSVDEMQDYQATQPQVVGQYPRINQEIEYKQTGIEITLKVLALLIFLGGVLFTFVVDRDAGGIKIAIIIMSMVIAAVPAGIAAIIKALRQRR